MGRRLNGCWMSGNVVSEGRMSEETVSESRMSGKKMRVRGEIGNEED